MRAAGNQLATSRSFSAHIAGPSDLKAERELSFSSYLEVVRHSPSRPDGSGSGIVPVSLQKNCKIDSRILRIWFTEKLQSESSAARAAFGSQRQSPANSRDRVSAPSTADRFLQ